jgi:hypothetical protein
LLVAPEVVPEVALDPDGTPTFDALGVGEPTFGVVTEGVFAEGVETVDPGTVTDGTVVDGTVPDGTDTVGRPAVATGIDTPSCIPKQTGTTTIPRLKIRRTITYELPGPPEPTQNHP